MKQWVNWYSRLLISSLPGSAWESMLNRPTSLVMSASVLKALPGTLDIKRHSPSILYLSRLISIMHVLLAFLAITILCFVWQDSNRGKCSSQIPTGFQVEKLNVALSQVECYFWTFKRNSWISQFKSKYKTWKQITIGTISM